MNTHEHESLLEAQEFYERAEQLLREDAGNMSVAVKCFRRALFLDPRNINAILRVAALYESGGADFKIDRRRQMALYLRAARLGHAPSQLKLGWAYSFHGDRETSSGGSTDIRVVPYDLKRAAHWFLKAAEQGNRSAQSEVGLAYFRGRGVEQDYTKASEWLSKSAMNGDRTAMNNLGLAYSEGLGVEQNLAFAATCYSVASRWGYAVATYNLGLAYEHGCGLDADRAKAKELFQLASEQNDRSRSGKAILPFAFDPC